MTDGGQPSLAAEAASEPAEPPTRPGRSWLAPLAAIAAIFLILTIAATAAVLSGPSKPSYASGSPQAAVQAWASAMEKGDYTTADSYLSTSLKASGGSSQNMIAGAVVDVSIGAVSIQGDRATVDVELTTSLGLGPTFTTSITASMVRESDGWKIDDQIGHPAV